MIKLEKGLPSTEDKNTNFLFSWEVLPDCILGMEQELTLSCQPRLGSPTSCYAEVAVYTFFGVS